MAGHAQDYLHRVLVVIGVIVHGSIALRRTFMAATDIGLRRHGHEHQRDAATDRRNRRHFARARGRSGDRPSRRDGVAAVHPVRLSEPRDGVRNRGGRERFPGLGGLGGLLGTIGGLGGGGLLDNVTSNEPTEVGKGNQILGQIFGSKDGSRAVAASASAQSGVEPSLLKKMLPILAMVAAGYVIKNAGKGGGFGSMLGGSPTTVRPPVRRPESAGSGDILGELIGAAGKFLGH